MSIQQEGVLELLLISGSDQLCLDVDSVTPYLAIGMAKRGVQTYTENSNQDILECIRKQSKSEDVSNKISFHQKANDRLKFDFILLTQNKIDVDALHDFCRQLASDGTLVLSVNNMKLTKVENILSVLNFSDIQVYLPFGDDKGAAFILPKEGFEEYYYRYWSWKTFNVWFWINKLVEYFFVFKLKQLWLVSDCIVLLKK